MPLDHRSCLVFASLIFYRIVSYRYLTEKSISQLMQPTQLLSLVARMSVTNMLWGALEYALRGLNVCFEGSEVAFQHDSRNTFCTHQKVLTYLVVCRCHSVLYFCMQCNRCRTVLLSVKLTWYGSICTQGNCHDICYSGVTAKHIKQTKKNQMN